MAYDKIRINGTLVWEKGSTYNWDVAWSGNQYLSTYSEEYGVPGDYGEVHQRTTLNASMPLIDKELYIVGSISIANYSVRSGYYWEKETDVLWPPTTSTNKGKSIVHIEDENIGADMTVSANGNGIVAEIKGSWYNNDDTVEYIDGVIQGVYYLK